MNRILLIMTNLTDIFWRHSAAEAYQTNETRQHDAYAKLVSHHKNSYRSLHWHSRTTQEKRFEAFLRIGDLNGVRILDIGCGLGDFCSFLATDGIRPDFTGYDIVEEMVQIARENCPNARFECRNILLARPAERFDYVFSSGIFAFGSRVFFEGMVRTAFESTETAYGFNVYQTIASRFFSPSKKSVLGYCETLGPGRLELIDDYLGDDFTVLMYK